MVADGVPRSTELITDTETWTGGKRKEMDKDCSPHKGTPRRWSADIHITVRVTKGIFLNSAVKFTLVLQTKTSSATV